MINSKGKDPDRTSSFLGRKITVYSRNQRLSLKLQFGFYFWYPEHYSQDHTMIFGSENIIQPKNKYNFQRNKQSC